jgi:hypothetical protein
MRAILPLLAAACLLTFGSRGRGEFDAGPVNAKATQATGATFGDSMANKRLARKFVLSDDGWFDITVNLAPPPAILPWPFPAPPQPIIKNSSNIPRPKR